MNAHTNCIEYVMEAWRNILRCITLMVLGTASACAPRTMQQPGGLETYVDIEPGSEALYFAFEGDVPSWLDLSLNHALAMWNDALGSNRLQRGSATDGYNVQIAFRVANELLPHPGKTKLLGCMNHYQNVANCRIELALPDRIENEMLLAQMSFLFRAGPVDLRMHKQTTYSSLEEFLRDKLALIVITHEIGHTLGLGHARPDSNCIMAPAPFADAGLCASEVHAARVKLASD